MPRRKVAALAESNLCIGIFIVTSLIAESLPDHGNLSRAQQVKQTICNQQCLNRQSDFGAHGFI
jgi:hypothetical protein